MAWVATSSDYGQTTSKAPVWSLPDGMGVSPVCDGFAYDPSNGQNLSGLLQAVGVPTPEESEKLIDSTNAGAGFLDKMMYMAVNPFPAERLKFAAGTSSEVAVRSQEMVYLSQDLGQTWSST